MKTIEKDLLQHFITDWLFAEYITPRIDIRDSDEDTVNRIYDGIVDLLFKERQVSLKIMANQLKNDDELIIILRELLLSVYIVAISTPTIYTTEILSIIQNDIFFYSIPNYS